jgi:hypothetical protein
MPTSSRLLRTPTFYKKLPYLNLINGDKMTPSKKSILLLVVMFPLLLVRTGSALAQGIINPPDVLAPGCGYDQFEIIDFDPYYSLRLQDTWICQVTLYVDGEYLIFTENTEALATDYVVQGLHSPKIEIERACLDCAPMDIAWVYASPLKQVFLPLVGR